MKPENSYLFMPFNGIESAKWSHRNCFHNTKLLETTFPTDNTTTMIENIEIILIKRKYFFVFA